MQAAIRPKNEEKRLESLERMNVLSTPREADLDRIVRIAQRYFGSEAALISLIDRDRQWFKARRGFEASETCRAVSFCSHAILQDVPFVIPDALRDTRFADNPLVYGEQSIRFYAGQSLRNAEGHRIGTLCIMSRAPRGLSPQELEMLQDLAHLAEQTFERRALQKTHQEVLHALKTAERERLLDPMTGLWNRRGLREIFQRALETAHDRHRPLALAMIDIDHFKFINDTHGHATGDEAIRCMAETLVAAVRTEDAVVRHGGDEFVVLLPDVSEQALAATGARLIDAIRQSSHVDLDTQTCNFTASVGLSVLQPRGETEKEATDLLTCADKALYQAKRAGRNGYAIVLPERGKARTACPRIALAQMS